MIMRALLVHRKLSKLSKLHLIDTSDMQTIISALRLQPDLHISMHGGHRASRINFD